MSHITLLLLICLLLALTTVGACALLYRRMKQYERRQQALVNVLRNEIRSMTSGSIGMGRRMVEIEQKLNITAEKQQELENRDPGVLAYNQATRLMEMGADVDDLVKSCGIGRPEAELMALLHRELQATEALGHSSKS
ncbi:DUF2802 domain-containing protein [Marinobacterium nitratireducens]|uniref:DUF2802 domain-containing protein n=1 Tax=Marinobacterium nitratireducens TaxID=518897 RepID=A0A917ZMN2_9GAMM|nr:DUF2802 domain-containing protein [Marinobacterium nitratireducens]GGO85055.1 DUF2802 domain-containing protein [Marinobacterium nitratireducens]